MTIMHTGEQDKNHDDDNNESRMIIMKNRENNTPAFMTSVYE
jgi:hypothetical protein